MATTVAKLEAQVVALTAALDVLITRVAALEARPTRATPKREAEAQTFDSPTLAMEACKVAVARRDGRRYWVIGDTLWNASH